MWTSIKIQARKMAVRMKGVDELNCTECLRYWSTCTGVLRTRKNLSQKGWSATIRPAQRLSQMTWHIRHVDSHDRLRKSVVGVQGTSLECFLVRRWWNGFDQKPLFVDQRILSHSHRRLCKWSQFWKWPQQPSHSWCAIAFPSQMAIVHIPTFLLNKMIASSTKWSTLPR